MRCLSCHYDLRNLAKHRCPECGRAFDPDNPCTFDTGVLAPSTWASLYRTSAYVFFVVLISLFVAFTWASSWQYRLSNFVAAFMLAGLIILGTWLVQGTRFIDLVVWKIRRSRIDRS